MLKIVTGPEHYPAAILIRGAGPKSGPGRLTKALQIDRGLDRQPALESSGLWFEMDQPVDEPFVERAPRIGIGYAPEPWLSAPYRFVRCHSG